MYAQIKFSVRDSKHERFWIVTSTTDFSKSALVAQAICRGYTIGTGLPATVESVVGAKPRGAKALTDEELNRLLGAK